MIIDIKTDIVRTSVIFPMPKKLTVITSHTTAKDVFYHLLAIVTLYVSVISFIALLFQYINNIFPDKIDFYFTASYEIIRVAVSAVIVVWPIYIFMSWLLEKDIFKNPEKRQVGVRKWLFYLTLFISAVTIIIDLIRLIYSFLSGELTIKFLLKILAVLITATGVFGFYLWDLNRIDFKKTKIPNQLAWIVSFVILITIVAGFFIIGTPYYARAKKFDERRISDLQTIQNEIITYWQQKNTLPSKLDDLKNTISGFAPPADPETLTPYEYSIINPLAFILCSDFQTADDEKTRSNLYYYGPYPDNWKHEKGKKCFQRSIDPQLYKRKDLIQYPEPPIMPIPLH